MLRTTCAVLSVVALLTPAQTDVDARTFAAAFRTGGADQYRNKQITGSGVSFHGAIAEKFADGTTRTLLVITLGAMTREGQLTPVTTWEEFVAS